MPLICYSPKSFRGKARARIAQANKIITEYQDQGFKLTLRQLYYQFVSRDLIPNTEQSYKSLGEIINDGRLAGYIDWDAIEDRTRNLRSLGHWDNPQSIVGACANQFSIDRWKPQEYYIEVRVEKDALIGVIEGVCTEYDVPYFACRGFVSQSEMWSASQRLIRTGKTTRIIHLGDHDPSGIDMSRDIQDRLTIFGAITLVRRVALNMDQITQYNPPPNPAKTTDSRYEKYREKYGNESWELDALEPRVIVELIRKEVETFIDWDNWEVSLELQEKGRNQLQFVAKNWNDIVAKRRKKQ